MKRDFLLILRNYCRQSKIIHCSTISKVVPVPNLHTLQIVMVVFIIVEFPQGVLNIVQSQFDVPHLDVIWDFFELCTLLTSCIIFGLFLTMNSRLREAFLEIARRHLAKFRPCCAPRLSFQKLSIVNKPILGPRTVPKSTYLTNPAPNFVA